MILNKHHDNADKTTFGFWIYIMTDCLLFASLFATFAVLRDSTAAGESGKELFSLPYVLFETMLLLFSSFTTGLALLAAKSRNKDLTYIFLGITAFLGITFLALEVGEFAHLYHEGSSWQASAFLSAFFTLVGTHGIHITVGLLWLFSLMWQLKSRGFSSGVVRRLGLFSLFWHFLDIIWIFIFSFVYLIGAK